MSLLHGVVLLPFILAIVIPLVDKVKNKIHTGWFVLIIPAALFVYLFQYLFKNIQEKPVFQTLAWIPSKGISFDVYLDGLGLLFGLLITGIGSLVVLYSIYYLDKHKEKLHLFYIYLLLFMGAMLGVTLSDNLIVLYMFWEVTSISSFLLIAYWSEREKSRYGAQKSMIITILGGLGMLAGFVLLYVMTGSFSIREIIDQAQVISSHAMFIPAMLLILLGAFTKSAQFPFHIWLPDAMEAPTPVSAYLHSATMVKAGIYLVARMSPIFAGQVEWFWLVAGFGLLTLFWGSFNAVRQTDLKAILAFSTVSQLGLIMSLLGLGSAVAFFDQYDEQLFYSVAVLAALFHLINHATFKGALFMMVGIVDHETGTRDIRKLGGLMAFMPITFTIAVIGCFSMAGLPPFNGFLSKEMFFTATKNILQFNLAGMDSLAILFPVVAWTASVFTFIYSMMLVFKTFRGKYQPEKLDKKPHEAPLGMLIPPVILASLVVVLFFFPNILSESLLAPAMHSVMPSVLQEGESFQVSIEKWHGFNTELFMSIGVFAAGILLYITLSYWIKLYRLFPEKLTFNRFYNQGLTGMERVTNLIMRKHMTGFTRDYLVYILGFLVLLVGGAYVFLAPSGITAQFAASISIYEIILALMMIAAALGVLMSTHRIAAIIAIGVVGYVLALFFVIFRAPDIALTQLVVETVSVVLFLLCFYHMPKLKKELSKARFRVTNLIVSLGVGTVVALLALQVQGSEAPASIANYFLENSYKLAGGNNVVNVILVDFRGFDTLLEILVLGIAALGVFAMIKLRLSEEGKWK